MAKARLTARQVIGDEEHVVVTCASMGECLHVVSEWMRTGAPADLICVVFVDADGEEDEILEWRKGYDSALGRDDWSLVS
jgi:hypothetical protein